MVFIILVIWVFAWTPYVVESMWIMFFDGLYLTPELAIAPSLCCKLSAALNAFIYGVRYEPFFDCELANAQWFCLLVDLGREVFCSYFLGSNNV